MTDSPSLLLQRAAERLEALARVATPPVWSTKDLSDFGHTGVWWVEAETEDMFTCVAELETVNPKADAAWIATMSPAVAAPLVAWLRLAAERLKEPGVRFFNGEKWLPPEASEALTFARLVLGVSAEGKERSDHE